MTKISYKGYRFPPEIIQQAIWLYLRFTLSFRDVEDLLAERGNLRQRIRLPDTCQIGFFSIGILSSIFGRDVRSRWRRLLLMFWCMKLVTISDFPMRICG
jgi:hypothetical protein